MATLFTSVADSLPRTAYIKLIDYWLSTYSPEMALTIHIIYIASSHKRFIANLCIPMVELLLHAIIDNTRGNDGRVQVFELEEENTEEMRFWKKSSFWVAVARVGLPIAYLLITLAIVLPGIFNIVLAT